MPTDLFTRRGLMLATGSFGTATLFAGQNLPGPTPVDRGQAQGGKVEFPPWTAQTETPSGKPANPLPPEKRIGFAVVGLGRLTVEEILPAFGATKKARVTALVSGSPEKAAALAEQYGIEKSSIYGYDSLEKLKENSAVKCVYIVLPNAMHKEYTLRAAAAGKHVLCEKPMANSAAEAREMVNGCKTAGKLLMIAYRCQYEPYNRKVIQFARSGQHGPLRFIDAVNVQNLGTGEQWRLRKALAGGGALPDIGIYCLNATRYVTGQEPEEVSAQIYSPPGDARYREVEETVSFTLRYPGGVLANCLTSYGMHTSRYLHLHTPAAAIKLLDAFAYSGQRLQVGHREGEAESQAELKLTAANQFALEMDHMAECIQQGKQPHTPGEEGLQDHIIMEAIYRAAADEKPVSLPASERRNSTRGPEPQTS